MEKKPIKKKTSSQHKAPTPKTPKKITESYLHNAGLYYLQKFSSSTGNFRRVMLRKIHKSCTAHPKQNTEECKEQLETLITKFKTLELLNDKTYTRAMVTSLRRRGKSARAITAHLMSKEVSNTLIQNALKEYQKEQNPDQDENNAEITAAMIFAKKKKIGRFRGDKEQNEQKELAAFARAGFSYEIARKIIFQ